MISAFRIQNLRAIGDSGLVQLAKINVLVGRNSAGKSTLLRVLPLLRQSVERPTKGPILWYGRFVDFGAYQNAVSSADKGRGVVFDFSLSLEGTGLSETFTNPDELLWGVNESARFYRDLPKVYASLTVGLDQKDEVGRPRLVSINLGSDQVECSIDYSATVQSLKVNGELVELPVGRRVFAQAGKILPTPVLVKEETYDDAGVTRKYWGTDPRPFADRLIDSLTPFFHGRTSRDRIAEFAATLQYASAEPFYAQLQSLAASVPSFAYHVDQHAADSPMVRNLRVAVLLTALSGVFKRIDQELVDFASSVKYVEPVRATAERYYRHQDLAVDEIDSRGENAAMFLNSLHQWEKISLKDWMLRHLGFYAEVEQGSGHVQVKIGKEDGDSKNIADLGFGYSQLLPIILQLWRSLVAYSYSSNRSDRRPVLAIEQPELHLHPQFQAQIADVLAAVLREPRGKSPSIFLETHSEHIVNRLGQLIANGRLKRSDVQILVVEEGPFEVSAVRSVKFDEKGFLDHGWPSGFFVPEVL